MFLKPIKMFNALQNAKVLTKVLNSTLYSEHIQVGESEKEMVFHSEVGSNVTISNNGTTIEKKTDESEKGMVFHSKVGSNVIISNNGRTIEKKDIDGPFNGAAFTIRPLENDELFEVLLDRKGSKFSGSFGIGVSTVRPEEFELPAIAYFLPHAWMYHDTSINSNGWEERPNYGVNIDDLPTGTRFGVMRKSSIGDVHFFINKIDQGSAISGISGPVYGVVDLYANAQKITILKP